MNTEPMPGRLHISIGSALAGFLIFGGLQSVIKVSRDPVAHAIVRLLHTITQSNVFKLRDTPTNWILIWANLAFGLIFIISGLIIGSRLLSKKTAPR